MAGQCFGKLLAPLIEELLVGDLHARGVAVVDDDHLEALAAGHRAQAAPSGVATGTVLPVVEAEAGVGVLPLAGDADAHHPHPIAEALEHRWRHLVQAPTGVLLGVEELNAVLADVQAPPTLLFRSTFDHNGFDAQLGQLLGPFRAGVRLLDRAGEGGLAADGDPT